MKNKASTKRQKTCKISKLLSDSTESKFVTRKWIKVNYLLDQYFANKNIRFTTPILRYDLCDCRDV